MFHTLRDYYWMFDEFKEVLLVVEDETQLDWIAWRFAYVGMTKFTG